MRDAVDPREQIYFGMAAVVSTGIYLLLVLSGVGILYLVAGAGVGLLLNGLFTGSFRGNGVLVSPQQLPDVDQEVRLIARDIGLREAPEVYVLQAGGLLNAFASRFLGRNYVVLFSDVVELARAQGQNALAFVIAHELAHHQRGHTGWKRLVVLPATWVPFLGSAYSRACEYTCDAMATIVRREGATEGLLVLAAGKHLYRHIDVSAFRLQARDRGFWVQFAEILSSHPRLPNRVAAVEKRIGRLTARAADGIGTARSA